MTEQNVESVAVISREMPAELAVAVKRLGEAHLALEQAAKNVSAWAASPDRMTSPLPKSLSEAMSAVRVSPSYQAFERANLDLNQARESLERLAAEWVRGGSPR